MRFIVYGVGAIGGTVAACLGLDGQEVVGIARGAQLDAIRDRGLLMRTPEGADTVRLPCHGDPAEIELRPDDVILLTMKTQDTVPALERLAAAGVEEQPILCCQNGVANERFALRRFANVYGVLVMMPAEFIRPGEVNAFGSPARGLFDLGRYPSGTNEVAARIAAALTATGVDAVARERVMEKKYGKLLLNLGNVIGAALGDDADTGAFRDAARREAEAVLAAAGIEWAEAADDTPRGARMNTTPIVGVTRHGSSSTQSLMRGTGSIETDYLNGEIVLLGRLHGVPAPVNAYFCALARRMVREGRAPGSMDAARLADDLRKAAPGAI